MLLFLLNLTAYEAALGTSVWLWRPPLQLSFLPSLPLALASSSWYSGPSVGFKQTHLITCISLMDWMSLILYVKMG